MYFSILFTIGQVFITIQSLEYNLVFGLGYFIDRVVGFLILWVFLFFLTKRGWNILKGKILIEIPESNLKQLLFFIGEIFLVISTIILLLSLVVLLIGSVGVEIGIGLSVPPFIVGIFLIEICKNKVVSSNP